MGLDNGLCVGNYPEEFKKNAPEGFFMFNNETKSIEFAYWRKCWNLRNEIMELLPEDPQENSYCFDVSLPTLREIRTICIKYLDPEYYAAHSSDMFWDYDEIINILSQIVKNIVYVIDSWEKYPDIAVCFYDSY